MDEHLVCQGMIEDSPFIFSDISLLSFKDFICKHIDYANLEAISRLENLKEENKVLRYSRETVILKFLKEYIYYKFPSKLRPFLFYFYRLFIRGKSLIVLVVFIIIYFKV